MTTLPIFKSDVKNYIKSERRGSAFKTRTPDYCPLACYLDDTRRDNPAMKWKVMPSQALLYSPNKPTEAFELPAWAKKFVEKVDTFPSPIPAESATHILDYYV